jgi:hypothetical protein
MRFAWGWGIADEKAFPDGHGGRAFPKADRNPVVDVDQPDRDGQVGQLLLAEHARRRGVVLIWRMGFGDARDDFRPRQRRPFSFGEG